MVGALGDAQRPRARLWLLDADFRTVACFRFSQAARRYHAEHRVLGLVPQALGAVWRRRTAVVHHFSIAVAESETVVDNLGSIGGIVRFVSRKKSAPQPVG